MFLLGSWLKIYRENCAASHRKGRLILLLFLRLRLVKYVKSTALLQLVLQSESNARALTAGLSFE